MFGLRSRVRNRDSARSTDTSSNEELLEAARAGDEAALAALVARYWERLERMVSLRMDRRLPGRLAPADVVQETYPALRGTFSPYGGSPLPFFRWLRRGVGQRLVDPHRSPLGNQMRDAGQVISLHRRALKRLRDVFQGVPGGIEEFWG
jgi:RNA polymerase sigma-70 factor (ECF subfamily)